MQNICMHFFHANKHSTIFYMIHFAVTRVSHVNRVTPSVYFIRDPVHGKQGPKASHSLERDAPGAVAPTICSTMGFF